MKNRTKIKLIIASGIVFIVLIILTLIVIYKSLPQRKDKVITFNDEEIKKETVNSLSVVQEYDQYYEIEKYLIEYVNDAIESKKEKIYNKLDPIYIKENNINLSNITNKIEKYEQFKKLTIKEIYYMNQKGSIYYEDYFIKGYINENTINYFIIRFDRINGIYSIIPNDFIIKNKLTELNLGDSIKLDIIEKNKNQDNLLSNESIAITRKEECEKMLENYIYYLKNNIEEAYNLLETNYRNSKFKNIEEFKECINYKLGEIENSKMKYYYNEDNICIYVDQNDNQYIFYKKGAMFYNIKIEFNN